MLKVSHVVIVGGGFSGVLLAINLLRHGTVRVTLIERHPDRLGRGLAFGAAHADHVLNVRAGNMSALPDQPDHFGQWLQSRQLGDDGSFATRQDYGRYLCALLDAAREEAGTRLAVVHDEVIDLTLLHDGVEAVMQSGGRIAADVVVIAPGNLPPHRLAAFSGMNRPAYVDDPWARAISDGLGAGEVIMLLGSGLTAVDSALGLDAAGFKGRIIALSRRGLTPQRHAPVSSHEKRTDRPTGTASELVSLIRARCDAIGWRSAVDELRPFTQDMWRAAEPDVRQRFLRHLRPYWDIHRHRIAPLVADRIDAMQSDGRLEVRAGKVVAARMEGEGIVVTVRPRGSEQVEEVPVARVVNCTGPLGDLDRTTDILLQTLTKRGEIRADPLTIGIDVDRQCRTIKANGDTQQRLFAVGPMTRGAHWEIVAVPDIRRQVWALAREMTGAHWVEAEGL